jgi:hypothetical protein
VPAETTAAKAKDPNWQTPRTAWGHPDLEGIWTSDDMRSVPTQRAAVMGIRETLTPEEFARRAGGDEGSRDRAVNQETFLRNEWGVRTFGYASLVVEPATGRIPDMTPAGIARRANRDQGTFGASIFNGFEDFTLYDRCITRGIVGSVLPVLYGNGMRILQTPDSVVISYEMVHDTRIIPLDGRPHVPGKVRLWNGDSRGRWEGNTLVVEVRNYNSKGNIATNIATQRIRALPQSEDLHVVERFTSVDAATINYEVTINDPKVFSAPWKAALPLTREEQHPLFEYACHEGNHGMRNQLSAGRAAEKEGGQK